MSKNRLLGGIRPVAQRELREGARRPSNYWLRASAGAAGLLMLVYTVAQNHGGNDKEVGRNLFVGLHLLLMRLICLVVPWMTADCIAREKREGTLGLLFLTPLTAGGIVAGKGLAQALRALTLWVAVAPMLTIPFLMGGVGWDDATDALVLEFSVFVLALAAGLLASTLVKGRGAALVSALLLEVCFIAVWCRLCGLFVFGYYEPGMDVFLDLFGSQRYSMSYSMSLTGITTSWITPIPALLLFVLVLRFAAWHTARSWQDKIPSLVQQSLIRKYCTPLFQQRFRRNAQRRLDRNPIAWLQQYSWKARMGKWVLCLAFVVVTAALVSLPEIYFYSGDTTESLLVLALAAGMTFAGINSFAEEKRSGALELILITPIPVNQIIAGRVLGVWKQFLPAGLMLAVFDAALLWVRGDIKLAGALVPGFLTAFLIASQAARRRFAYM